MKNGNAEDHDGPPTPLFRNKKSFQTYLLCPPQTYARIPKRSHSATFCSTST